MGVPGAIYIVCRVSQSQSALEYLYGVVDLSTRRSEHMSGGCWRESGLTFKLARARSA